MIRPLFSLLLSLALALVSRAELVVRNPVAGFSGSFVPDRFNLLSVEVQNRGAQPFEGGISLDDGGIPYEQSLFVSPGSTRWVQFYPFITSYQGTQRWKISWADSKGRGDSMDLLRGDSTMPAGAPTTVIFNSPDAPQSQQSRLRSFMENLFPPSVTATDGLHAAVLDHVPRWDAPRRQAFRDWVHRGGVVHLLHGIDGKHPEFSDELAALNTAGFLGAGRIVKHAETRESITTQALGTEPQLMSDAGGHTDIPSALSRLLPEITKPKIPWGFIYFLTVVYVALIGPVFYMQRKRDYRVMLAAFAVTVALFAWLFTVVGRRGYGEKQILHSVGYAESLGGNRHATMQWMHAFATSSDSYRFQYPGNGNAYASLANSGTVKASVRNGAEAAFQADIPLFSGRPFIHSGTLVGDDTTVDITEWKTLTKNAGSDNGRLEILRIKPNANFPKNIELMAIQHRDRIYRMEPTEHEWITEKHSASSELHSWFSDKPFNEYDNYRYNYDKAENLSAEARLKERLGQCGPLLMAKLLGAKEYTRQRITVPDLDTDSVRLFIYTRTPQGFVAPAKDFQFGGGYILYSQTLRNPAATISKP